MKTRIWILAALIGFAGLAGITRAADTDEATEMTDEQAVQALRDLGLPPETLMDLIRNEVRESAQTTVATDANETTEKTGTVSETGATPPAATENVSIDALQPATDAAPEMTDEQAVQALRDLGLPPKTILNLIRKKVLASLQSESEATAVAPKNEQPAAVAPQATTVTVPASQTIIVNSSSPIAVINPPTVISVDDFRRPLARDGIWVRVDPYGLVWQPIVTILNTSWRPYFNDGSWEWTDDGWCWRSRYSWGWATFHYGRWAYVTGYRWIWIPDIEWAPSWVQWRHSGSYIGWAPLPPEARYHRGSGFRYHDRNVSIDCDFGLTEWHYSFVPSSGFAEVEPCRIAVPRHNIRRIYSDTVNVRNTYTTRSNVTLPTLPREVTANAGRRTQNLQRIVNSGTTTARTTVPAAGAATQVQRTTVTAPSSAATTVRNTGRVAPSTAQSIVVRQPATASAPAPAAQNPESRSSALLDVLRRRAQKNVAPVAAEPATVQPKIQKTPQPKVPKTSSQAVREDRTTATATVPAPAPVVVQPVPVPQPRAQTPRASTDSDSRDTSVKKSQGSETQDSGSSSKSGSRSSRLQNALRDKQDKD